MTLKSETNVKISDDDDNIKRKYFMCKQALSTGAVCLTFVSTGISCSITSVMLPELRVDKTINYEASHESWIASILNLSMIIAAICCGIVMDRFGRKLSLILVTIPMFVGWIIIACANSTNIILLGRFITGISAGANRPVAFVYIGEISDPKIRSILLYVPGLMAPVGFLASHMIGYYLGWRKSSIVFASLSAISFILFLFLKESPLWLIAKGRISEGVETFRWFRGTDEKSENELKTVEERQSEKPRMTIRETLKVIRSRSFVKPIIIVLLLMTNSITSGLNVLNFYSQDIFEKVFSGNIDPFVMTMGMDGIRNLVSLAICVVGSLVPRKMTYLISNFVVTISASALFICFETNTEKIVWIPVVCLVIFMVSSCIQINTGYTFVPELMPTFARGLGSGLVFTCTYLGFFVIIKVVPDLVNTHGVIGLFAFFAIFPLIIGVILSFTLPETSGKTLQSIEDGYDKRNVETKTINK